MLSGLLTPKYLYHCTDIARKNEILNSGLKLDKARTTHNIKLIYLSLTPQYCYGNTCFKINVDGLDIKQTINIWEFVCSENIPSERIEYFGFDEVE